MTRLAQWLDPTRLALPLAVAAAALGSTLPAQTVRGTVVEHESRQPLAGVTISLSTPQGDVLQTSESNERGEFAVRAPGKGQYLAIFRRVGFQPAISAPFEVGADDVELFVSLVRAGTELDTVVVRGKRGVTTGEEYFTRHQALGRGTFFGPGDIENAGTTYLTEVLEKAPDIWIDRIGARMEPVVRSRKGCLEVRINLQPLPKAAQPAMDRRDWAVGQFLGLDEMYPTKRIAGVEVYPRFEDVPAEWQPMLEKRCGAVMIWTNLAW